MQFKSFINKLLICSITLFCSLNADKSSILSYREIEENKIIPDILVSFEDLRIDAAPYDGECTADHVYYRDNDERGFSIDLTSHSSDHSSHNSSDSYEKPDTFFDRHDSSQNDITRYNDAESNLREVQGYRYEYQGNDCVPDYNIKEASLIKTNEIQLQQKIQALTLARWPDAVTIDEESHLWQQELGCWKGDSLREAQCRKEKRIAAYQKCKSDPVFFKQHYYELSGEAKTYLYKNQINAAIFQKGFYNAMQHQLHTEFIEIAEELTCYDMNVHYPDTFKLVHVDVAHVTAIGVQCNKMGDVIKAATIADFAWKILECGQAVLKGGYDGLKSVGSYAYENPHEVLLYGVAPEIMSGYYTLKLIHSIGSLVIDIAQVGATESCKEALKNTNLQGVLHGTASILAQICFNNVLNKFSVKFVGKSKESLAAVVAGECPTTYAALKDVCKARAKRSSDNIKNIKHTLFKDIKKGKVGSESKIKIPVLFSDLKQAEADYRGIINHYYNHIFQKSHNLSVICSNEKSLIENIISKVTDCVKDSLFCEGNNQILTLINGHKVTIRVNISNGKFRSTNIFLGWASRISDNQINL
ncbi:MAG: polymorphic toxin type 35 domain-containing protein [Candidatus Babeliales bacterium]